MDTNNARIWFAVDEDGSEWCFSDKPERYESDTGWIWATSTRNKCVELEYPLSIAAITGQTLTWESEPLEWVVGERDKQKTITDDAGNTWLKTCPNCGNDTMHVVRPGKVQCSNCE